MATVFHTSEVEIKEIRDTDLFGDVLFFSDSVYRMNPNASIVYSLEIADDEIWSQWELFRSRDEDVRAAIERASQELADCCGIDADTAEEWLTDEDAKFDCEHGWAVQKYLGKLAKYAEITAIKSRDEQGTVYIVPMSGKLEQLQRVE